MRELKAELKQDRARICSKLLSNMLSSRLDALNAAPGSSDTFSILALSYSVFRDGIKFIKGMLDAGGHDENNDEKRNERRNAASALVSGLGCIISPVYVAFITPVFVCPI